MKCPRTFQIEITDYDQIRLAGAECIKEECAWWRDDIQMCAIKDLSLELGYTQLRLADIADKMPHGAQFRK